MNARNQGSFTFSGLLTGNAFADFMLGLPDQTGRIPNVARVSLRQRHFYAYVAGRLARQPEPDDQRRPALRVRRLRPKTRSASRAT